MLAGRVDMLTVYGGFGMLLTGPMHISFWRWWVFMRQRMRKLQRLSTCVCLIKEHQRRVKMLILRILPSALGASFRSAPQRPI